MSARTLPNLLADPYAYFQERVKYPTLRPQAIIVFVFALVSNVWYYTMIPILGATAQYIESVLYVLSVAGMIEYFLWWLILTAIMYAVLSLQGATSSYGHLLRLTGYGFAPMILSGVIWSAGWYLTVQGFETPPGQPLRPGLEEAYAEYQLFMEQFVADPVLLASTVLGGVFVLVSAYLWYLAVQVVSDLEGPAAGIGPAIASLLIFARVFTAVV